MPSRALLPYPLRQYARKKHATNATPATTLRIPSENLTPIYLHSAKCFRMVWTWAARSGPTKINTPRK